MTLQTTSYPEYVQSIPQTGQVILAQQTNDSIIVYQAYNKQIADYAVEHQKLGGPNFSYNRMSWIKPNFLWMMYRAGWATKPNQEHILAIWLKQSDFEKILSEAAYSSFQQQVYASHEAWSSELAKKEVRLQWDPDHDPYGNKLERRAIQLGMKGSMLKNFGESMIQKIEDITEFVSMQREYVDNQKLESLLVPVEKAFTPSDEQISIKLQIK